MHAYQQQDSRQTLAQALEEYHAVHPGLSDAYAMSPEGEAFFRRHDVVHVIYGCGIDLDDEAVVKIASMVGTTAGLGVLRGYVLHETLDIYRQCGCWKCLAPLHCPSSSCLEPSFAV